MHAHPTSTTARTMLPIVTTLFAVALVSAVLAAIEQARLQVAIAYDVPDARLVRPDDSSNRSPRYSANWTGAVLHSPVGELYDITATFEMPDLRLPREDAYINHLCGSRGAHIRVGMDNIVHHQGTDDEMGGAYPFYHTNPGPKTKSSTPSLLPHDSATLTVLITSPSADQFIIREKAHGRTLSTSFATDLHDAEWIVEVLVKDGALVPRSSSGEVVFTDAHVAVAVPDGSHVAVGLVAADLVNILHGHRLTKVELGPFTVGITYLPGQDEG